MKDSPLAGFDRYISLGDNCEAGLQFWRIGYNESSIFRFTFVDGSDKLINVIENDFADIFDKENLVPASVDHMVRDIKTGIAFHSKLYSEVDAGGKRSFRNDYDFDKVFAEEKTKIEYFVQKWRELVSSEEKVLYFFKCNWNSNRENAESILNTFLKHYPEHDFLILYIQPKSLYEPDWGYERLRNVYVDYLAPYDNAEKGADSAGWDELFKRYPLKNHPKEKKLWQQKNGQLFALAKKLGQKLRKLS